MLKRKNLRNGLIFVSPWIVGFSFFLLYPIISSIYYSFTEYSVIAPPLWRGWRNYLELFNDEVFWISLYNTMYYFALSVPLQFVIALSFALLLNAKVRAMSLFRTFFFLPTLVPIVASAILWMWIFNGQYGILNAGLKLIGVHGPGWLTDPVWAKPSLVMMGLWGVGGPMIIYLAALQDVPVSLYESSFLDGANWWQRTLHITVPLISPAILFNVVMAMIDTLQLFTQPFIMTEGGPGRSTEFYVLYLWENAFQFMKMGYASAMAWILFVIILVITLIAFKSMTRRVYYGGK